MRAEITDDALVTSARAGSEEAAGELFDRHWRTAWRASYALTRSSHVAEDCAQEAFERALGALADYRGPSFRAWVSRIAVNLTLNQMRKDRRLTVLDDETRDPDAVMPTPDAALALAVDGLAPDRRIVVVLRYWLDYSPPEIAEVLEIPVGTVHSRLSRALEQLRERMEVGDAERA